MAFDVYTTSATSTLTADEQSVAGECVPGYYSEPADFSVARNPAWNGLNATSSGQSDAYAKYTVTNLGTSTVYKRDTRYSIPYTDQSVMADAVRRIGQPGIIEVEAGISCSGIAVGVNDTNQTGTAYWSPSSNPNGPFSPIIGADDLPGVTIRNADPAAGTVRLRGGVTRGTTIKNTSGQTVVVGGAALKFEHVNLHHAYGAKYVWEDFLYQNAPLMHGLAVLWNCALTGDDDFGGLDCISHVRGAYGAWDLQDCSFGTSVEHSMYLDAAQGLLRVVRCFNTSNAGVAGAFNGRTFLHLVGRAQTGDPPGVNPYFGGPAGHGDVVVEDCVATHTGQSESSGAITIAGFQGDVRIRRCSFPRTGAGMITVWTPSGGGFHTDVGTFIAPTAPNSGAQTYISAVASTRKFVRPFNQNYNWLTDGFEVGKPVTVSGWPAASAANNGVKIVASVTATELEVTTALVDAAAGPSVRVNGPTGPYLVTTAASAAASDDSFTLSSGDWLEPSSSATPSEAFRASTSVTIGGWSAAANNGTKTITALTSSKMSVSGSLANEAAGTQVAFVGVASSPYPKTRSAFSTLYVLIEDVDGYVDNPYPNPTSAIAVSGARLVEVGDFDVTTSNFVFGFWVWDNYNGSAYGGPLDNGEVRFLSPPLPANLSTYAGFHSTSKVKYGSTTNPNHAGNPYSGGGGSLSAAGMAALVNVNSAYPPWVQPLAGAVFTESASISAVAEPGDAIFEAGGAIYVDGVTATFFAYADDTGSVLKDINRDFESAGMAAYADEHSVLVPIYVDTVSARVTMRAEDGDVLAGITVDTESAILSALADDATVTVEPVVPPPESSTIVLPVYAAGGGYVEVGTTTALGYSSAVFYEADGTAHAIPNVPPEEPFVGEFPAFQADGTRWLIPFVAASGQAGFASVFGRVRERVDSVLRTSLSAQVQYDNAPSVQYPMDVAVLTFARVRLGTVGSTLLGVGQSLDLRFSSRVEVELWTDVERGAADVLSFADLLTNAVGTVEDVRLLSHSCRRIGMQTFSVGSTNVIVPRWGVELRLDFDFDVSIPRAERAGTVSGEFLDAANAVQSAFDALVAVPLSMPTLYDNSSQPDEDGRWCRVQVDQADGAGGLVHGTSVALRRRAGFVSLLVHVPVMTGDRAAWDAVDSFVRSFAGATRGGCVFDVPTATLVGRDDRWWIVNATCSFSADDVR